MLPTAAPQLLWPDKLLTQHASDHRGLIYLTTTQKLTLRVCLKSPVRMLLLMTLVAGTAALITPGYHLSLIALLPPLMMLLAKPDYDSCCVLQGVTFVYQTSVDSSRIV